MGKDKNLIVIAILIAGAFLVYIFGLGNFALIKYQGSSPQTKTYTFDGITVRSYSVYFGNLTDELFKFYGSTDKTLSISNTVTEGNELKIVSSITGQEYALIGTNENYILSNFTLPKGTLTGVYSLTASSSAQDSELSTAVIKIDGKTYVAASCDPQISACDTPYGVFEPSTGYNQKGGSFTVISDGTKNVQLSVLTTSSGAGGGKVTLTLNFVAQAPVCKTSADTNCDGSISRTELGEYVSKWIYNQITREEVAKVIQAWSTQ